MCSFQFYWQILFSHGCGGASCGPSRITFRAISSRDQGPALSESRYPVSVFPRHLQYSHTTFCQKTLLEELAMVRPESPLFERVHDLLVGIQVPSTESRPCLVPASATQLSSFASRLCPLTGTRGPAVIRPESPPFERAHDLFDGSKAPS